MPVTDPLSPLTTVPVVVQSGAIQTTVGVQAGTSYMREFHDSRRITEDIQRGTLEHVFMVNGHPNEAILDAGLAGMNIGNPHPWWNYSDLAKDMYLIRRAFELAVDRSVPGKRWTRVTMLYQKRTCPFSYEEEYTTTYTTMQTWWSHDPNDPTGLVPKAVPITLAEGYPVEVPQMILKRHWPHVVVNTAVMAQIRELQTKLNGKVFYGQPPGVWKLESVQAKRLFGMGDDHNVLRSEDHWEVTVLWKGDPVRHHELWIPKFPAGSSTPIRPASMSFTDLAAVHDRNAFYVKTDYDFDNLFSGGGFVNRCLG